MSGSPSRWKLVRQAGAQLLLTLNASPYHIDKQQTRMQVLKDRVAESGLSILYVNMVGGQDELVFDGASLRSTTTGRSPTVRRVSRHGSMCSSGRRALAGGAVAELRSEEAEVYSGASPSASATTSARTIPGRSSAFRVASILR